MTRFGHFPRGLAQQKQNYMNHLVQCDMQRRNDLDGVGNLSEEAMLKFTQFMYDTLSKPNSIYFKIVSPKRILLNKSNIGLRKRGKQKPYQ